MRSLTSSSEVAFASLLVYSPRGVTDASRRSKQVTIALKQNDRVQTRQWGSVTMAQYLAARLAQELPRAGFADWFDDAVLVPVPRSSPRRSRTDLWPAREIATEMVEVGVGRSVLCLLERAVAVPKSAYCSPGERPGPEQHQRSFALADGLPLGGGRIVLVDDVVTRGATLLGAALRLRAEGATATLSAFAAVRTMSEAEVSSMLAPCVGIIRATDGAILREP